METVADLLVRHAVAVLAVLAALMLLATFVLWRIVERFAPWLWTHTTQRWTAFRSSTAAQRLRDMPRLGPALSRTAAVGRYLGIYALVSFVIALGAVIAFFELAEEIGIDEDLARFDAQMAEALSRHLSDGVLRISALVTHLGDPIFLIALGIIVTLVLLIRRRVLLAGVWAASTSLGALLNLLLKAIFERTRPVHEHGFAVADGWSFPSGHASGAMLVYGLLAYLLIRHTERRWHLPIAIAAVALIVFVGFSRVLLQVHFVSDVLAGYMSAAAWGLLCVAGLEAARWRTRRPAEL